MVFTLNAKFSSLWRNDIYSTICFSAPRVNVNRRFIYIIKKPLHLAVVWENMCKNYTLMVMYYRMRTFLWNIPERNLSKCVDVVRNVKTAFDSRSCESRFLPLFCFLLFYAWYILILLWMTKDTCSLIMGIFTFAIYELWFY